MLRTLALSQSRRACSSYLSSSSCFQLLRYLRPPDSTPLLQPHYRTFAATTGRSAPTCCFGTLASRFWPLVLLPCHQQAGSRSFAQKPVPDSCPLYAGRRPPSHQAPDGLVPGVEIAPRCNFGASNGSSGGVSPGERRRARSQPLTAQSLSSGSCFLRLPARLNCSEGLIRQPP